MIDLKKSDDKRTTDREPSLTLVCTRWVRNMRCSGHFFVTNLVVKLRNLVGRDWRTSPLFIGATFVHSNLLAPTYRTMLALLLSVQPRFSEVCACAQIRTRVQTLASSFGMQKAIHTLTSSGAVGRVGCQPCRACCLQMPSLTTDGDAAMASAISSILPRTKALEDYTHWKDNVLEAIGGPERHRDFARYILPLVDAATYTEFDGIAARLSTAMPKHLWRYLNAGAGDAQRSPLQRTKCMSYTKKITAQSI